ncbi:MAG: glycolate oxidase iron-sulfur subunit [Chloroflexia bacterium]|nr:glycolate oxidase iron-sulfur subunit [Chloroflexia bacterium]
MEQSRDKEQREEAATGYERTTFGVPAHVQAAAEAAGQVTVRSGPQDIGVAAEGSGVEAVRPGGAHAAPLRLFPAFDSHHPPSEELIDDCVHCGFCLPTCPTYLLWGEEMDSPRGRIHLMKAGNEGRLGMTDTFVRHFDQCLGCMACVTACPSGVQYNKLIEATRSQVERRYSRNPADRLFRRLIFTLFPYPARLRLLAPFLLLYQALGLRTLADRSGLLDRLPARLRSMNDIMPRMTLKRLRMRVPAHVKPKGQTRARVGLLTGCVQQVFFPHVNAATVRVLAAEGCEVIAPAAQACCGALALHAGYEEQAQQFARKLIEVFEREKLDYVAVNAAGCGSTMKEYGHLLRDDPEFAERAARFSSSVRDINELLVELGPVAKRHPIKAKIAYHDACHLAHAQGIRREPRTLLQGIPGVEIVPVTEAEICCGSAGIYNLVEPQPAGELGERKARHILATGAKVVASANPGCTLQIEANARRFGVDLKVLHPVEILDRSLHPRRKER